MTKKNKKNKQKQGAANIANVVTYAYEPLEFEETGSGIEKQLVIGAILTTDNIEDTMVNIELSRKGDKQMISVPLEIAELMATMLETVYREVEVGLKMLQNFIDYQPAAPA